ncbi:anoctamin-9 [Talpa occidentalis]|uniref:anoctamin-9 n=1 Tax=Talpa occidentalis TaxID=50954 RepID=UPI00188EA3F6|nr:anoctamin-9 [Talpa occidentalis]
MDGNSYPLLEASPARVPAGTPRAGPAPSAAPVRAALTPLLTPGGRALGLRARGPLKGQEDGTRQKSPKDEEALTLRQSPKVEDAGREFLTMLRGKGFHVVEKQDQKRVFFGIRAGDNIFSRYSALLPDPEGPDAKEGSPSCVKPAARIRIVNFILGSMRTSDGKSFKDLVKRKVFETRFPLHKEEEKPKKWARWRDFRRKQPIDEIRSYFGEKVALYFAWLEWYTWMLVPAAAIGLIIFLSGFSLFDTSQISKEICTAGDVFLCPRGDHDHDYQRLSDTCAFAKLTHLFDNEGTVLFAFFMAVWATVFLELWKRRRARVVLHWGRHAWDEDQEEIALALIAHGGHTLRRHQHSYLGSAAVLALLLLMICLTILLTVALVLYRVVAAAAFRYLAVPCLEVAVVATGAVAHYVMILVLTKVNRRAALKLCDLEKPRTFSERESKFMVKFFILQFFTHFSSLIYTAFILGRINGHPGKSVRLWGLWKLEECHLSGCMMDLFVQMAVIMVLKQMLSNFVEYLSPWLSYKRRCKRLPQGSPDPDLSDWQRNYLLNEVTTFSLFDEFMEMMIQYGFTTTFVAAFPLAPLLALVSNVVELRLDAIKMARLRRRLVPRMAKDIGTWLQVLETIGVLAVIANGMVISFTSEFIPRLVYQYRYGPCRGGARPEVDCLTGYVNHSLSVFYTKDLPGASPTQDAGNVTECRYRDYRNAQDYGLSQQFWVLLAIRMAFLILFEHVALCIKLVAAWFVPDVPQAVKNRVLEDKFEKLKGKMKSCSASHPPSHKITEV